MDRHEFIDKLRISLNGKVPAEKAAELVEYYNGYITEEMRTGKSEAEVLELLGDPRLIVRSIVSASTNTESDRGSSSTDYRDETEEDTPSVRMLPIKHPKLTAAVCLGAVLLILLLLFKALVFFAPFLFVLAIVYIVIHAFQK